MSRQDSADEDRKIKRHPRDGYVVAVYVGMKGRLDEDQVLVEVHECYNMWGDENSKRHHYRPYDLSRGKSMEIKTVGGISAPVEGSPLPPSFVQMVLPGYEWRRLR